MHLIEHKVLLVNSDWLEQSDIKKVALMALLISVLQLNNPAREDT